MIQIKNVSKIYNKNKENMQKALDNVTLQIDDGEFVAITGESGSGKSTLIKIIGCNLNYDEGFVEVGTEELSELSDKQKAVFRNEKVGVVFQDFLLVENISVQENVALPLYFKKGEKNIKNSVIGALKQVEMFKFAKKEVSKLSGGEKQRVAIARAMVNSPKIILADEPTGALDTRNARIIMDMFKKLNSQGITVIIVTHSENVAKECHRRIVLQDGKIILDTKNQNA